VAKVTRQLGVPARTARYRRQLRDELADHPDVAAKVDSGEMEPAMVHT